MVITLVNLIVDYVYPSPQFERYCNSSIYAYSKPYPIPQNCTFNRSIDDSATACTSQGGNPIYNYDDNGCYTSVKSCDLCSKEFDSNMRSYNRISFFIFAFVGFVLIVLGLFIPTLLLQLISLPAGAVLVIESAMRNFDSKLSVIIVLTLLVIAAIYLALKKLR